MFKLLDKKLSLMFVMNTRVSKLMLTAHVTFSLGWFGTIAAFLVLSIAGLTGNEQVVKACYLGMDLIAWFVILPFCLCSLLTGLTQSLFTHWGLFKHWWIFVKFLITLIATVVLLLHMQPISYIAKMSSESPLTLQELSALRIRLIADAGAALLVLVAATTISVYKPWGKIRFVFPVAKFQPTTKRPLGVYLLIGFLAVMILFTILHIMNGGMNH
jgi:hypothetical protein